MIDLDHFKRLNDEHGHAVGDAVLRDTGQAITGALRQSDVACRYGGEELIVLMPDVGLADAAAKAEALRLRIESISERHGARVTASLGVASVPDNSASAVGLVALADEALYQAKKAGRNQVVTAAVRPDPGKPRSSVARIA
jgi:diguanylate cyclase (GGDEF)-like protein